ncbi:MAG: hypothetical protein BWX84_00204 [Verrucomicrobia bacterium ADurb.Bin118]|nr:MAG: hypothetical protein BWX84_00204 [Verrucomicrobia bacterium ADurb.Bin118]
MACGSEPAAKRPNNVLAVAEELASSSIRCRSTASLRVDSMTMRMASSDNPEVSLAEIEYAIPAITKSKSKFPPSSVIT